MPGVVGSAVALGDDGLPTVVALVEHGGVRVPPGMRVIVTGKFSALDWQAVPQGKPECKKNCDSNRKPDPSEHFDGARGTMERVDRTSLHHGRDHRRTCQGRSRRSLRPEQQPRVRRHQLP